MERKLFEQSTAVLGLDLRSFAYFDSPDGALHDIQLEVHPGSLTVISGHSGSGKSTLGAILAGLLPRHGMDQLVGRVALAGAVFDFSGKAAPRIDVAQWAKHAGLLPQETRHYLSGIRATVAEELAFSLENAGVPREQMQRRVSELARRLQLEHLLERHPGKLSGGQERLVALAALAITGPEVLVLDEPLAGLDAEATALVSEMIFALRSQGTALVVLCGKNNPWASEADSLWSLEQGALQRLTAEKNLPHRQEPARRTILTGSEPAILLSLESVDLSYPGAASLAVKELDLQVRSGECLGLAGANGTGKTTVLKYIAGLLQPESGILNCSAPTGMLLQNSSDQLFERTVRKEVSFGIPRKSPLQKRVPEVLAQLGLENYAETHPYELPASARKLLALATVLVREPQILLLDEPTETLDEAGEARLLEAINSVLERGGAVVLSTHDQRFMNRVADRVHRMPRR